MCGGVSKFKYLGAEFQLDMQKWIRVVLCD